MTPLERRSQTSRKVARIRKRMAQSRETISTQRRIERVHLEFPHLTPPQIAARVGCSPSLVRYVRAGGIPIPYGKEGRPGPAPRRWNLASGLLSVGA